MSQPPSHRESGEGSDVDPSGVPAVVADLESAHDHGVRALIDGALAVTVGLLAVVQARINGELALIVDSGFEAAALSFGTGLVFVALIVLAVPNARAGVVRILRALRRPRAVPLWIFVGGFGGATLVASQGIVVPVTGVALFAVAVVAGQSANSLLVDKLGIGPGGPRLVTWARMVAAGLAVVGVFLAVSGELGGGDIAVGLLLFAFVAGAAVALQQGLNGRVAVLARAPLPAALVNFIVGFTTLVVLTTVVELFDSTALVLPPPPWDAPVLWLGGPIGVAFVAVAAFAVRGLGVLVFSMLTVVGQLIGGVLVDLLAPVPSDAGLTVQTVTAVVLTIGATVLAYVGGRRLPGTMAP